MGSKKVELAELRTLEAKYQQVCKELGDYRQKYLLLQEQYPPESDYLCYELKALGDILDGLKREALAYSKKIIQLKADMKAKKGKGLIHFLSFGLIGK